MEHEKESQMTNKEKAIKLHSQAIRSTGYCEKCKRKSSLTTAHIIKRRYSATVADTRNAFCLCIKCHAHFERHKKEFDEFIESSWAAKYLPTLEKRRRNQSLAKYMDWEERIALLTDIKEGRITLKEARQIEDN